MVQIAILHPESRLRGMVLPGDAGGIEDVHVPGIRDRDLHLFGIDPTAELPQVPEIGDAVIGQIGRGSLSRHAVVVAQPGYPQNQDPDLGFRVSTQDLFDFRRRLKTMSSGWREYGHQPGQVFVSVEYLLEGLPVERQGCDLNIRQVLYGQQTQQCDQRPEHVPERILERKSAVQQWGPCLSQATSPKTLAGPGRD